MKFRITHLAAALLCPVLLSSCIKDDPTEDYTEWNAENQAWVQEQAALTNEDGTLYYTKVIPLWAPGTYVLMHWHKRTADAERILPMDNSTVDVKYQGRLMDGTVFDDSYSNVQYGDSIARFKPSATTAGFHTALTQMAPGDSVTVVMPCNAGYGATGSSSIKPYSALEFDIMMKQIVYYNTKP